EGLSPKVTEDKKRVETLQNGQVAMALFGSWNLASFSENDYIREHFDVAVLPKGKKQSTIFNGLGNAISANTKHPDETWKWIE
ncbi:extracellular solute-binding protein, partial [Streptococcus pyogenes]